MDANEQRARFEAWANDYDPLSNPQFHYGAGYIGQVRNRYRPISYADADLLWQAWRAALALQVPADGEGYRLAWEHLAANSYDHHTPYMVCIPTDEWKAAEAMLAATPQAPQPVVDAPSVADSKAMGAKGGPSNEAERLAFEAWMHGHCWALCATWDGAGYRGDAEQSGRYCPDAARTRGLWAAWRDRAALAASQPQQGLVPREPTKDMRVALTAALAAHGKPNV